MSSPSTKPGRENTGPRREIGLAGGAASGRDAARLKGHIRARYGALARAAAGGRPACCGGESAPAGTGQCCGPAPQDAAGSGAAACCAPSFPSSATEYSRAELAGLPPGATTLTLGCGNPTALVDLLPGETVLDLGSGGGLDVLLSARRVGPTGRAYGLDLTDDMLTLARENLRQSGLGNAEFLKGDMEAIPLPDASVDVVISNCVLNLAADKDRAFSEVFRVLRPGGRLAVTDIVFQGDISLVPAPVRGSVDAWCSCVGGALEERDYVARLEAAGFVGASVTVIWAYEAPGLPDGVRLASGFVRARKPVPAGGPFHLRPAEAGDLPAVRRLVREVGLPVEGLEDQFPGAFIVATSPVPGAAAAGAQGQFLAGTAGLEVHGRHGLLRSLAVDELHRGRDLGRRLVEDILARARELGLEAVWLLTSTAAGYFPRFGFAVTDRAEAPAELRTSVEFARACPGTATFMRGDPRASQDPSGPPQA